MRLASESLDVRAPGGRLRPSKLFCGSPGAFIFHVLYFDFSGRRRTSTLRDYAFQEERSWLMRAHRATEKEWREDKFKGFASGGRIFGPWEGGGHGPLVM